eukprot:5648526-Prymnesium_polylepis.1
MSDAAELGIRKVRNPQPSAPTPTSTPNQRHRVAIGHSPRSDAPQHALPPFATAIRVDAAPALWPPCDGASQVFIQPGASSPEILELCSESGIEVHHGCVLREL